MAGRAWSGRAAGAGLAALLLGAASCAAPPTRDSAGAAVEQLLQRRAAAVLDRDEDAYEATGSPDGEEFDNLDQVPLSAWEYRLVALDRTRTGATATADLAYRIDGYDRAPVTVRRTLVLERQDGRWQVTAERPGADTGSQLWEQGEVTAVRGQRSLVLGVGRDAARLKRYAELADRAVPAVQRAWGRNWSGRLVVLVPRSTGDMAALLGASAAAYQGIAAVTTGAAGGGARRAPADRIIVNPESYDVLGAFGKQVVLTHEATHVATRAHTSAATPLWLSEGLADWVGYRASGRGARQTAPELTRAVRAGQAPRQLPEDDAFGFAGDASRLARAYESGWLACRMIAERRGERALVAFYEKVGAHKHRAGAVENALRDVLNLTPEQFTEEWRAYVRGELG